MTTDKAGIDIVLNAVKSELIRAIDKHAPMNSHHEAYAVLLEEVDEFWEEVKKQGPFRDEANMVTELVQIAAMAIRAIIDTLPTEVK